MEEGGEGRTNTQHELKKKRKSGGKKEAERFFTKECQKVANGSSGHRENRAVAFTDRTSEARPWLHRDIHTEKSKKMGKGNMTHRRKETHGRVLKHSGEKTANRVSLMKTVLKKPVTRGGQEEGTSALEDLKTEPEKA